MAIIKTFKAIRPQPKYARDVLSLPYDVMNRNEAEKMSENNPFSFLHICRSEIDLPHISNPYSNEVYLQARKNMDALVQNRIFIKEEKPCLYIYRQIMNGRAQTGIVACASIDDYQNNVIKKHEFTRHEKELDRIRHFDTCNANTEPVFLTYRHNEEINRIISKWISESKPVYDILSGDNIRHMVWVIDSEIISDKIISLFKTIDALYIADGHHRTASAVNVGLKRRERNPSYKGNEAFNFFLTILFPDRDLKIFDYNRVVRDLNGLSPQEFLGKVEKNFHVTELDNEACPYKPNSPHTFGMHLGVNWYKLVARDEILNEDDPIGRLDVSILQDNLLAPILGIEDPRKDDRIDFVGGIRGLEELQKRVKIDMAVAFALYPVSIDDLLSVSDHNLVMPPKSTWFEPKLGSGLFIHELED
jgi:uncharacterized protein (DUF1015 family)